MDWVHKSDTYQLQIAQMLPCLLRCLKHLHHFHPYSMTYPSWKKAEAAATYKLLLLRSLPSYIILAAVLQDTASRRCSEEKTFH